MADEPQPQLLHILDGIDKPKDVHARDPTILNRLVDIGTYVVDKYTKIKIEADIKYIFTSTSQTDFEKVYLPLFDELNDKLKDVLYDEEDLASLVLAETNADYDLDASLVQGIYTSCLLHLLTIRNYEKGRRTRLHINGQGNRFNHLFSYAHIVDELILENFCGDSICSYIGSYRGAVNRIVVKDIKGDCLLSSIGTVNGTIEQIIGINLDGENKCFYLSVGGANGDLINQIILINVNYARVEDTYIPRKDRNTTLPQIVFIDSGPFPCNLDSKMIITDDDVITPHTIDLFKRGNPLKIRELAKSIRGKDYIEILEIADQIYVLRPQMPVGSFEKDETPSKIEIK